MEGNASVYQVNTAVSRITGEGRAEFLRTWGPDFDQKGGGRGGGRRIDHSSRNSCLQKHIKVKSGVSLRCARSILVHTSPYSRLENRLYRLPPKNDYYVYIARSAYHYACARQTQVNWRKKKKGNKMKGRKEKKRQGSEKTKKRKEKKRSARNDGYAAQTNPIPDPTLTLTLTLTLTPTQPFGRLSVCPRGRQGLY